MQILHNANEQIISIDDIIMIILSVQTHEDRL